MGAAGIRCYRMTLAVGCLCVVAGDGPFEVVVFEGRVPAVRHAGESVVYRPPRPLTVEGLFRLLEARLAADVLEVRYDPLAIRVDPDLDTVDDERSVRVAGLARRPEPPQTSTTSGPPSP